MEEFIVVIDVPKVSHPGSLVLAERTTLRLKAPVGISTTGVINLVRTHYPTAHFVSVTPSVLKEQ